MTGLRTFCCVLLLQVAAFGAGAQIVVNNLSVKIGVDKSGVYRIDYNMLKSAGVDPGALDLRKLVLLTYPTGMLPQSNAIQGGTQAVQQVALQVVGGEDGRFDNGDFIIFYAQGPDHLKYIDSKGLFSYQNNLYSDFNFYFLATLQADAQGVVKLPSAVGNQVLVTEYADVAMYERDLHNDLKSGRDWVGEIMDTKPELTIRFEIPGIVANSTIKVTTSLMAQSYAASSAKILWNGVQILERTMPTIPETQYGAKGAKVADTVAVSPATVGAVGVTNQDIKISFAKASSGRSVAFLDYVVVNTTRKLAWYGNPTTFTILATTQANSDLEIGGAPADAVVWDITNPYQPTEPTATFSAAGMRFGSPTATGRTFIAFQPSRVPVPASVSNSLNNAAMFSTPDLLIVSAPEFMSDANRLAAHRRTFYGLEVVVATPDEIYDIYSGGRHDITAIRNYVRDIYRGNFGGQQGKLKNLLLFGRGSYDYKGRVFNNTNFVPIYESVNSLSPLETYASDDYFALLEDHEGNWGESPAENSTLEIGVGRIPIRTTAEAAIVVDKLIAYDTDKNRFGGWRKDILFVADDGDWNIHQGDADELAEDIENTYKRLHTSKLYLDAYDQQNTASGQTSPDATDALNRELDKGYSIINYTGHGNEYVWMDERVLDQETPYELPNNPRQPLFVTATCEFGRHDNPLVISTAEALLMRKKGGAIALVTTTRPVHSTTNFSLNKAFYSSLFDVDAGGKDLGTIFKETKNKSMSGISNRNFSLLGDPSMRFGLQPEQLVMNDVGTLSTDSDTLKALSEVLISGEVRNGDVLSSNFNGTVEISLYDKRSTLVTQGDENEPFSYKEWDHTLFRGQGKVQNGTFSLYFRLPANLNPVIGNGKLAMYAYNSDRTKEVVGTATVKIGGVEANPGSDSAGPSIELFLGDTTFVNGGFANNNTLFVARLFDKNGINTSGYAPASLTADLDGIKQFVLNEYYVSDLDDHQQGTVTFPLNELAPGSHRITFTAYDNFNNSSTSTVDFVVGETNQLVIEEFLGYPNPFSHLQPATFQFTHSRSGDDLEAQLLIYNSMGQLTAQKDYFVPASGYRVTLAEWDGQSTFGAKMSDGIYLAKLSVRSLSDGAKNAKIAKLILAN